MGALTACAAAPVAAVPASAGAVPARPLLPDLDQQVPTTLQVERTDFGGPPRYALGFESAVRNIGDGPLQVVGRRASLRTAVMAVHQVIRNGDGSESVVRGAGHLRYAVAVGHHHWHYLGFDRYELRRAGGAHTMVRDHKSGFCLGDRYRSGGAVPAWAPASPAYTSNCGLYRPRRLSVSEGISVGYGDDYVPYLEGQSLALNGLADGRYVLIHRVNGDRRLRETRYDNDAASVLVELRWDHGVPSVRTLAACPDDDHCDERVGGDGAGRKLGHAPVIPRRAARLGGRTFVCALAR